MRAVGDSMTTSRLGCARVANHGRARVREAHLIPFEVVGGVPGVG